MLAVLLSCVAVILITYLQVFKQGLFSSAVHAGLAIISAVIALNWFEPLAALLANIGLASLGPQTIALMALFNLSLLILREITDRLLPGNMNFPLLIDRLGATFFALIGSLVAIGMCLIGLQLLPIQPKFLWFDRYGDDQVRFENGAALFPYADSLVVGTINALSDNSLSGPNNFRKVHPNFLRELYLNRVSLDPASRKEAAPKSASIDDVRILDRNLGYRGAEQGTMPWQALENDRKVLLAVRLKLKKGTGDDRGARDVDGKIRVTLSDFRMVGYGKPGEDPVVPVELYPVGILANGRNSYDMMRLNEGTYFESDDTIDLLYLWPGDAENPKPLKPAPLFIEFKRSVRLAMPKIKSPVATEENADGMGG